MDNSLKNISKNNNQNIINDNIEKMLIKRDKINENLKSEQYYYNQSNNTSLKENKNFISQTNTLEISRDSKIIESNKISYILSSGKKDSKKNLNNKTRKEKRNLNKEINKERKELLSNKFDILSPKYIFNNKNTKTKSTENNNKVSHINNKKNTNNKSYFSSNKSKNFDISLKQKKMIKTSWNFEKNELNYDNIRLVKMPYSKNSNILFYNNKNKSIHRDIILKSKKKKYLSTGNTQKQLNNNKRKRFYSLNEDIHLKNNPINIFNNLHLNTENDIKSNNNKTENISNLNALHDMEINLAESYSMNNKNLERKKYFSEEKVRNLKIGNEHNLINSAININFNEIERILNLDNNINEDEILNEIDINKDEDKNNNIPDHTLEKIPEEDLNLLENGYKTKEENDKNEKSKKNVNKKMKIKLNLNENVGLTMKNKILEHKEDNEKNNNKAETCTNKNKIKKITDYFHNNKINNKNQKSYVNSCHTVRNNKNIKIIYTESNEKNNNNILNNNKLQNRLVRLNENIEEKKKGK